MVEEADERLIAKTFVMTMLYLSHPLPTTDLDSWVRPDCKKYSFLSTTGFASG